MWHVSSLCSKVIFLCTYTFFLCALKLLHENFYHLKCNSFQFQNKFSTEHNVCGARTDQYNQYMVCIMGYHNSDQWTAWAVAIGCQRFILIWAQPSQKLILCSSSIFLLILTKAICNRLQCLSMLLTLFAVFIVILVTHAHGLDFVSSFGDQGGCLHAALLDC